MTELDKELMPFYRWVWKHVNRPKYLRWMNVFSSFTFDCGLCTNSYLHPNPEIMSSVLRMHFREGGLDPSYPFNSVSILYDEEVEKGTLYQNPARLAWIKEKCFFEEKGN